LCFVWVTNWIIKYDIDCLQASVCLGSIHAVWIPDAIWMLRAWSLLPERSVKDSIPLPTNLFTGVRFGPQISALHICFQSTPNQSLNGRWSVHWYGNKRTDRSQLQNTSLQTLHFTFPAHSVSRCNRWLISTWSSRPVFHCRMPQCRHSLLSTYSRANPVKIPAWGLPL
jgi:hypothetical protein